MFPAAAAAAAFCEQDKRTREVASMNTMISLLRQLLALVGLKVLLTTAPIALAFQSPPVTLAFPPTSSSSLGSLFMGLYDKPLPPQNDKSEGSYDNDDGFIVDSSVKLFAFDKQGNEVHDLLPSLNRRLDDKGASCYFEPTDRLVQNLVTKTACNVEDAAWALEACRGDVTEAWTHISYARRMRLMNATTINQTKGAEENRGEWDARAIEKRFQKIKQERLREDKRKEINIFQPEKPNENWLPRQNPRPIDDEPWFTG